jgi:hypothetical protein
MEIKPTGSGGSLPPVPNDNQQVSNKTFSGASEASGIAAQPDSPLSSVLADFKKADLQDPAKVEQMLSQCAGGLLSDAAGQSQSKLSPDEKSYLTGWLQSDPSIRGKLLSYLEKVLK